MKFAVETWAPEYGSSVDGSELEQSAEAIDVKVEVPEGEWEPLSPDVDALERPDSIAFVDGIRRIDARIWITDEAGTRPGLCATVAAGVVVSEGNNAEVVDRKIDRGLYTAAIDAGDLVSKHATYWLRHVADDTPEQAYLGVHNAMTSLELEMSQSVPETALVLFDGPLRGRTGENAVGFIKTQHRAYLEGDELAVMTRLEPGQRTPLFFIGGRFPRFSWYVRLPGDKPHPLAGVVRCERAGDSKTEVAAAVADLVAVEVQRFASEPHKDTRAPQNLYPVAGLENDLRRHLGDPQLLERSLRVAALGVR